MKRTTMTKGESKSETMKRQRVERAVELQFKKAERPSVAQREGSVTLTELHKAILATATGSDAIAVTIPPNMKLDALKRQVRYPIDRLGNIPEGKVLRTVKANGTLRCWVEKGEKRKGTKRSK